MKNVQIKELSVLKTNELLTIVEQSLFLCQDTQIYITDKLFTRFMEYNKGNIIWEEWVLDSFHYSSKEERAVILCLIHNDETKTLQMHFVKNSTGYMQLSFFARKGIVYQHYLKGMETILIINSD